MRHFFQLIFLLLSAFGALAQTATNTNLNTSTNVYSQAGGAFVLDDKHVLEPGDRISFYITEDNNDPPKSLVIADSRELDAPYVGRVSVAGKTCKQLAADLKVLLEKEYYYRATVIIGLDSVNKVRGKVYIWGQVHNQGPVDLLFDEKLTVSKAILKAGGPSDFANRSKVKVFRKVEEGEPAQPPVLVDLDEVLTKGKSEQDVLLEPGDSIYVPARLLNF